MAEVLAGKQQVIFVGWMGGPLSITLHTGFIFMQRVLYYTHTFDSSIAWIEAALAWSVVVRSSRSEVAAPG